MTKIASLTLNDTQKILNELQKEKPNLNKIGKISKESPWNYYVNAICHRSQPRFVEMIQKMNRVFADQEQQGVKIFDPTIQEAEFLAKANSYRAKKHIYLDTAQAIGEQTEAIENLSPELKNVLHELKCRQIGMRYSLGKGNGGLDPLKVPDSTILGQIKDLAQKWKDKQSLAVQKKLDVLQEEQLVELAKYPEWLKIVMENPTYLSEVLSWTLHNFQRVEIIVKNYETTRRIKAALLPANLGYVRNIVLTKPEDEVLAYRTVATKTSHVSKRILTAPIYHGSLKDFEAIKQERVNILKPSDVIHFKQGNYHVTIDEFFKELSEKNTRETNITLCAEWGFANFHPVKGVWNANTEKYEMPPMKETNWIDDAPPSRIASHQELLEQYGDEVANRNFFIKVMATRQDKSLKAIDCHAYLQLCHRIKDGNWKVVNIGFYAYRFQQGLLDGLSLFCATVLRVVSLLDQNCYYSHRQRGDYPIFCENDAKNQVLKRIFKVINTKGVFQFAGRNCAHCVQGIVNDLNEQEIIEEEVSNFFKIPLTKAKIGVGLIDGLLGWAENKWQFVQWLVMTTIHSCFFSHRTLLLQGEKHSVRQHFKKEGFHIHNPSFLHHQIDQALDSGKGPFVKGELYWSHTDEKKYQKQALLSKPNKEVQLIHG